MHKRALERRQRGSRSGPGTAERLSRPQLGFSPSSSQPFPDAGNNQLVPDTVFMARATPPLHDLRKTVDGPSDRDSQLPLSARVEAMLALGAAALLEAGQVLRSSCPCQ